MRIAIAVVAALLATFLTVSNACAAGAVPGDRTASTPNPSNAVAPQPAQVPAAPQRTYPAVDPSSYAWAYGRNNVNPSPSAWAFGNNKTVYSHPLPPAATPPPRHCHGPSCRPAGGHWEWVQQEVWVPGYWRQWYYPARYEYRMVNGLAIPQLVQAEHYENVYVPGYYQWNTVRVWVRGSWSCGF